MRVESSVTSLSWIPSEAVTGANKGMFEIGFTHYDDPPPDFADAAALYDAQRTSDRRLIAFCERQTEESLAEGLVLPRPNRTPPPTSVASVLAHLFQHQIHHRGQAHAMLSSTGVKPPQLDEFFLAGEEHLRRDELRALGLPET